jgi:cytochrome c553
MFSDRADAGVIAGGAWRSVVLEGFRRILKFSMVVVALHLAPALPALSALAAPADRAPLGAEPHQVEDSMAQRAKACTGCHGPQGRARPDGYVPRLAGKPAGYLHEQLTAFQQDRRRHDGMARMLEPLGEDMLWALARHFEALEVPYPAPVALPLSPAEARRAEQLVRQGDPARQLPACAACHGTALAGVAPHVPGLLGLPVDYLNGQLGAWRQGHRRAREPDCMATVARNLPLADVALVSRWLASQPVPGFLKPAATAPGPWPMRCGSIEPTAPVAQAALEPPSATRSTPLSAARSATSPPASASASSDVAEGAYLALVGNCAGCHTAPGGAAYAGGRAIDTPFGAVYAGNLTPDAETGLGRWTADSFWRALHQGRSHEGRRLIPAFPYTSYTHLTRQDSDRLFAYLRSLPPVRQAQRPHALRWPFGTQPALAVWQWLYFRPGKASDPRTALASPLAATASGPAPTGSTAPDPLARGAYLVNALGHCAECHAPRNRWGALGEAMTGGVMPGQNWFVPSLHPLPTGSGPQVTAQDLADLLRTGRHRHGSASGPMASVVLRSTQHWSEADLQAAATYLARLPTHPPAQQQAFRAQARARAQAQAPADEAARGRRLYAEHCADCHGRQGQGVPGRYSPLAGNPSVTQADIRNLVQMLQHGGFAPATRAHPRPFGMPPQELNVAETTALLNHLRQSWGHRNPAVAEVDVIRLRR